jgi:hypothetical protein
MQRQMSAKAKCPSTLIMGTSKFTAVQGSALARNGETRAGFREFIFLLLSAFLLAACAPTFESHIDAPPEFSSAPVAAAPTPAPIALAPLDPRPLLPDAGDTPCPPGSGLGACFTPAQNAVRQERFRILHDDRDYCRDAYERAVKRASH